jgi:hypothetical protein
MAFFCSMNINVTHILKIKQSTATAKEAESK